MSLNLEVANTALRNFVAQKVMGDRNLFEKFEDPKLTRFSGEEGSDMESIRIKFIRGVGETDQFFTSRKELLKGTHLTRKMIDLLLQEDEPELN